MADRIGYVGCRVGPSQPAGCVECLAALAAAIEPVGVRFLRRPQLSDPNDEMVLEAAVNGRADVLVTHNLVDFRVAGPWFGLALMPPAELLRKAAQV